MNNVTPEKKGNLLKSLAVIGLFAIIILIAWLSVKIVTVFPSALNSLASLADSVYSYNPKKAPTVVLKPVTGPIITENEFTVAWEQPQKVGTYAFSYECQEGIAIEIKTAQSNFSAPDCNTSYELGAVDSAQLIVSSEKKSVTEVLYTISYFKTNSTSSTAQESQTVTVLNPRLAPISKVEVPDISIEDEPIKREPEIEILPEIVIATSTEPELPVAIPEETEEATTTLPTKPLVNKPAYEFTYIVPVSDPKGFTDLAVSYLGIGKVASNGSFVNTGILNQGVEGAVQFSVKNNGTKTSADWYFNVKLPGGVVYESPKQLPLKPNERAVLTLSFPAVTNDKLQSLAFSTKTNGDVNTKNNEFTWSVIVIK